MQRVQCLDCGHQWRLNKSLDDYEQGPRCSECGSYEIEAVDDPQSTAARAFQFFIDGGKPHEAVANGLGSPEEVSNLWEHYQNMTDDYEALREEVADEVREELRTDIHEELEKEYLTGLPCAECGEPFYIATEHRQKALWTVS